MPAFHLGSLFPLLKNKLAAVASFFSFLSPYLCAFNFFPPVSPPFFCALSIRSGTSLPCEYSPKPSPLRPTEEDIFLVSPAWFEAAVLI